MCDDSIREPISFLQQKSNNFRAYLLANNPDAELTVRINGFEADQLMKTLTLILLPAVATMGLEGVANEMMAHLSPPDILATKAKVLRYIQCFCELAME